jgi:outer membrane protein TolC
VIDLALRDSPRVRASRLRAETRREGIAQAGALPDPMLSMGLLNRPFDFGADQPMTMNSLQLSQRLPWKGKRSSSTEAAEGLTRASDMDAAEASVSVVQQLRSHYYRMAYIDRAVAVMERTRGLLSDLQVTASTMYSVGTGVQQDMLQAQVAEARMAADIRVMQEQRIASGARFNALLGHRPDDPIGALELPDLPDEVVSLEQLMRLAEGRPAVQAARARVEAATAARAGAYRAHLPDVNVTLGYGQRPNFDDLFTVMIGVPLPVRRGSAQEPLRRQTTAAEAAAEASEVELYNETYAQLAERRAQAARAIELSELLRTDVVPQAQAAVESGLSAYRVGALDFMAVLQSQMTVNQFEVERLRLAAEYQSALAAIDALIGVIPGGVR